MECLRDCVGSSGIGRDLSAAHFLAAVLLMPDGTCIPFAKCMETKTANETRKKLTEVLAQVVAMSDGQIPLLRVHSDCGGEFTADSMCGEGDSNNQTSVNVSLTAWWPSGHLLDIRSTACSVCVASRCIGDSMS